jgi:hypothetical protein
MYSLYSAEIQNANVHTQEASDYAITAEIIAEQAASSLAEEKELTEIALAFVLKADGDADAAEKAFDNALDLLLEAGTLSMWRYRAVLAAIREWR